MSATKAYDLTEKIRQRMLWNGEMSVPPKIDVPRDIQFNRAGNVGLSISLSIPPLTLRQMHEAYSKVFPSTDPRDLWYLSHDFAKTSPPEPLRLPVSIGPNDDRIVRHFVWAVIVLDYIGFKIQVRLGECQDRTDSGNRVYIGTDRECKVCMIPSSPSR